MRPRPKDARHQPIELPWRQVYTIKHPGQIIIVSNFQEEVKLVPNNITFFFIQMQNSLILKQTNETEAGLPSGSCPVEHMCYALVNGNRKSIESKTRLQKLLKNNPSVS